MSSEISWQEGISTTDLRPQTVETWENELLFLLCWKEPSCGFQISDYMMLPDTATLSERLRVCLQEGDENPRDFTTLFDLSIYQLDTTSLPKVIKSVPGALWATLHFICVCLKTWAWGQELGLQQRSQTKHVLRSTMRPTEKSGLGVHDWCRGTASSY